MNLTWFPGDKITSPRLNARNLMMVTQANDLTLTGGSTNYQPSEIILRLEPGATYSYFLFISYSAYTGADFRWRWDAPDGCLLASFTRALILGAASGSNTGANLIMRRPGNLTDRVAGGTSTATSSPGTFNSAYDVGTIQNGGVVGNLTLEVDRNDVGGDTILRGGNQSRLLYQRLL